MHLLNELPCAVLVTDAAGKVLLTNEALCSLAGATSKDWQDRYIDDLFPPAGRIFLQTHIWPTLMRDKGVSEIYLQVRDSAGKSIPVLLNVKQGQHAGQPCFYWTLFVARERSRFEVELLNARSRAEASAALLAQSEAFVRSIANALPGMVAFWDMELRCKFANEAYLTWFGESPEQLVGIRLPDLLGPDVFRLNEPYVRGALAGERQQFERNLKKANGELGQTLATYIPQTVDGKVIGFLAHVADVTPFKQTQELLRRGSAALSEAQRLGRIGSWEWLAAGDTRTWSDELFRILERDPAHGPLKFADYLEVYVPASASLLQRAVDRAMESGEPYVLELEHRRSGGALGWVEARGEAVADSDGAVIGLRGTVQDITDRKQAQIALVRSQDLLGRTGRLAGVGGWEVHLPTNSVLWTDEVRRIHGVPLDYVPSLEEAIAFYAPSSQPKIEAAVAESIKTGVGFDLELEIIRRDGALRWVRVVGSAEYVDGAAIRLVGAFQDVTEHRRMSAELVEKHELMRVTLESIGDAVITTDATGHVDWLNPVAEHMTGWLAAEAKGLPMEQVFHIVNEHTRALAESPVAMCLQQRQAAGLPHHTLLISRDGREFGIEDSAAPILDTSGTLHGVVLVFHDVSEQRRMSGEMTYRATHDSLTGLLNRGEFDARLARALRKAQEEHSEHALLYIDLDQFKLVNDACGHAVGDELLQQVAKLLADAVRTRDTLARLGGDEFAIILEHCSIEQAYRVAQKICDRMDDFRFIHDGRRFRIGTSIGLVLVNHHWTNTSAIQQAADTSCYAAKEAGRNRVHTWLESDAAMRARHTEMGWTSRIERALDEDGFVLFAQRIHSLGVGEVGIHAEVLLRMKNDDDTLTPPGAFLPAAERFHLASRVDRWVLRNTLAWMKQLDPATSIGSLSVNLSGQSVSDRTFHVWASELLADAGVGIRAKLCIEVTETAAVTNLADAALFIQSLRASGVRVALDDFGAGASSFGYLKSLPVDYLKIDGQFVRDVVTDPLDDAAVRCFVDVARVLGIETVAEFVDDPAVLQRLITLGVDFAQGYLLHKPEPIDALARSTSAVVAA
ncbi:MAG: EAL domain-containing protein [Burkholderiales bacterium]|nr:EAL domain-containing protein [Burkholderiales bacterium]